MILQTSFLVRWLSLFLLLISARAADGPSESSGPSEPENASGSNGPGGADSKNTYEYIVVGSGPGGGPLAANLARAGHSVLLIEAGDDQGNNPNATTSFAWTQATEDPKMAWDFFVNHTDNAAEQNQYLHTTWRKPDGSYYVGLSPPAGSKRLGVWYPRAGTLGGCAMHNAASATLPNDADWDYIAQITGDNSWKANNMRKYFVKLENNLYLPNPTPGHGFGGWLNISQTDPSWAETASDARTMALLAVNATGGSPSQVISLLKRDLNSNAANRDQTTGVFGALSHTDTTGVRSSPNNYIKSTIAAQYPLKLQLNSLVTKILFSKSGPGNKPTAIGVEYLQGQAMYSADPRYNPSASGTLGRAYASKEVIISGGTFNSPQILKLSGIGPAAELRKFGIPVLVDLPGVGTNLGDNQEGNLLTLAARPFVGFAGIFDLLLKSSVAAAVRDVFMFCGSLSFEGFWPGWPTDYGPSQYECAIVKMNPRNQAGTVLLKSANPRDTPVINLQLWGSNADKDLQAMLEAVKFARGMLKNAPSDLQPFNELHPCPGTTGSCTDAQQKQYLKLQVYSHHASSTCAIGGDNDRLAVLDSKFRVRGVNNLRVVDASAHPRVPGAFPVLPTFMISEKAADVILGH